jgi:hypothetical protein
MHETKIGTGSEYDETACYADEIPTTWAHYAGVTTDATGKLQMAPQRQQSHAAPSATARHSFVQDALRDSHMLLATTGLQRSASSSLNVSQNISRSEIHASVPVAPLEPSTDRFLCKLLAGPPADTAHAAAVQAAEAPFPPPLSSPSQPIQPDELLNTVASRLYEIQTVNEENVSLARRRIQDLAAQLKVARDALAVMRQHADGGHDDMHPVVEAPVVEAPSRAAQAKARKEAADAFLRTCRLTRG